MKKKLFVIITFLILAASLSACVGGVAGSSWPALTVDTQNGVGYLAYNQAVYAIDLNTGLQTWKFPAKSAKGETFYSAPVLANDQLIAGSYNHILYSINPTTGVANTWSYTAKNRFIASPLVYDNAIYAPLSDGKLLALDMNFNTIWNSPFVAKDAIWAQPTPGTDCQCIYVASMDHHLYAISQQNGSVIWSRDLGSALVGKPTLSPDGKIYIGSFNDEMFTIDAKTGDLIGQPFKTEGWIWGGPALVDGMLYFGDLKGNFYVLNTQDGTSKTTQVDGAIIGTPLVISDTIYVTTEAGNLYTMDKDGKVIKPALNIKGKLQASPLQYKDMILITPQGADSYLIALDANGNQVWAFPPPKAK